MCEHMSIYFCLSTAATNAFAFVLLSYLCLAEDSYVSNRSLTHVNLCLTFAITHVITFVV